MDLKFLCEINKMEKALLKDKTISAPDLMSRIYKIKEAGFANEATKNALQAISMVDSKDTVKLWRQFAKDNKVKINCL